jgi:hypothetical protein
MKQVNKKKKKVSKKTKWDKQKETKTLVKTTIKKMKCISKKNETKMLVKNETR